MVLGRLPGTVCFSFIALFTTMSTRTFYTAGAVLATALLVTACSKPAPSEEPVRAVKVSTVGVASIQSGAEFSGEVRPRVESRLGFRVAGKLVRRPVELGQTVKAGQVLAQLDPQDYKLATEAARAQVAAAATNRDLAAADFKRFKELRDQNFISGAELERRETTLKAAQAQLDQAQAQLNSQGNQASYTTLVADVSGVVTAINAEPGQVVTAGTPDPGPRRPGSTPSTPAGGRGPRPCASCRESPRGRGPPSRCSPVLLRSVGPEGDGFGATDAWAQARPRNR